MAGGIGGLLASGLVGHSHYTRRVRVFSVSIPVQMTVNNARRHLHAGAIPVLTWGGLRGGIAVALASDTYRK